LYDSAGRSLGDTMNGGQWRQTKAWACCSPIFFTLMSLCLSGAGFYACHLLLIDHTDAAEEEIDETATTGWFIFRNMANSNGTILKILFVFLAIYAAWAALLTLSWYWCRQVENKTGHLRKIRIVHYIMFFSAFVNGLFTGQASIERLNNSIISARGGIHTKVDPSKPLDPKIKGGVVIFQKDTFLNLNQSGTDYYRETPNTPYRKSIVQIPIVKAGSKGRVFFWGGGCYDNSHCVKEYAPLWYFPIAKPPQPSVCETWRRVSRHSKSGTKDPVIVPVGIILRNAPNCNPRAARVDAAKKYKLEVDENKGVTIRLHEDPEMLIRGMMASAIKLIVIPTSILHLAYLIVLCMLSWQAVHAGASKGEYQQLPTADEEREETPVADVADSL